MTDKKFKLIIGAIIPKKKVDRESEYGDLLDEFLKSGTKAAKIDWEGNKPNAATVAVTLRKMVSERKLSDSVKVHGLSGAVYLESTEVPKEQGKGKERKKAEQQ
jgi:hypothetical protein